MINRIKRQLLSNPDDIVTILELYDYCHPVIRHNEIRFGLQEGSNPTGISIKLNDNEGLFVKDFIRGYFLDLFQYIIKTKHTTFKAILDNIKSILGIDTYEGFTGKRAVFGGFYDRIKHYKDNTVSKVYPDDTLLAYPRMINAQFLRDNISSKSHKVFEIGYDPVSQRITIPIRNIFGELIGVKGRATWKVTEEEPKYLYIIPCLMSSTLFGYSHNYEYLRDNTILIGESEKFVMQAYTYGIRNCVSVGSHSLSDMQCKAILELNPRRVIFMFDKNLDPQITKENAKKLKSYGRMFDFDIMWWDWRENELFPEKASPSDMGSEEMMYVLKEEVYTVESIV